MQQQVDGDRDRRQTGEQDEPHDLPQNRDRVRHEQEEREEPDQEQPAEDDDRQHHAPARRELERAEYQSSSHGRILEVHSSWSSAGRRVGFQITASASDNSTSSGSSFGCVAGASTRTVWGRVVLIVRHASIPPRPGIATSMRIMSGRSWPARLTAVSPESAAPTSSRPSAASTSRHSTSRNGLRSSTASTRA